MPLPVLITNICKTHIVFSFCIFHSLTSQNKAGKKEEVYKTHTRNCATASFTNNDDCLRFGPHTMASVLPIRILTKMIGRKGNHSTITSASWMHLQPLMWLSHDWFFSNPMDCSPPGFSVHEISQARILEWVAISFIRRSSQPRSQTHVSWISRRILYHWVIWKPHLQPYKSRNSYSNTYYRQISVPFLAGDIKWFKAQDLP